MGNARHVFFRDSTGKASTRPDGKYNPTNLLARMGESSVVSDGGGIGWRGWPRRYDALFSSFVIQDGNGIELNDRDTKGIVQKALNEVAKKAPGQPLLASEVLKASDRHAATFFQKALNKYLLVTSLSVKSFPAKKVTVRGSVITPLKERGKRYPLPKVLQSEGHRNHFATHLNSTRYQLIRIETQGRSVFEGVGKALDDLNLLRALWSFEVTLGRWTMRLGSGTRKPIGVIHAGPVYTLHNADGSAADEEIYWFDPDYTGDQDLFRQDDQWGKLEKERKFAMRRLSVLPYGKELEELFTRYIMSLDQSNPNVAFLKLWGILEKLTDTVGAQYDETIKRACWVYTKKDRPVMKETLEALRHHRNRYVHSGNAGQESEEITYRIKSFVDPHLVRLLNNAFKVQSLQEYGEFLSYPTDINTLEQIRNWSTRALRAERQDAAEEAKASHADSQTG